MAGIRDGWKFNYPVAKILKAAEEHATTHRLKQGGYQTQVEEALEEIREKGIVVEEKQDLSHHQTYMAAGAHLDPKLKQKLDEAQAGVSRHRNQAQEYERWVRVLRDEDSTRQLELTVADVEFFRL